MAQYYNLKNILDDLKITQRQHKQINSFGTGDITQLIYLTQDRDKQPNTTNAAPIYPLLYVIPQNIQRDENFVTYNLSVLCTDKLNTKNFDNEIDASSDTAQMLSDVLAQFKYSVTAPQGNFYSKYDIVLPTTMTYFSERYDDILVGWTMNLQVIVSDPLDRCLAPFNPFEVSPSPTPTNTPTITITPSITPTITSTPTLTPTATPAGIFCVGSGFDYRPTVVKYNNGYYYVGGSFEFYQGNRAPLMVKINAATGEIANDFYSSIYATFGNTGLIVNDIEFLSNGKFFAGGFYQLDSLYQGLNLFNSDGSADPSFQIPLAINNTIRSITINSTETRVYVTGAFTSPAGRIAAYDLNGNIDLSFSGVTTGFNSTVYTVERDASDNLFVGGLFTSYNNLGGGRRRLAKLDQYGNIDSTFTTGMGTGVDNGSVTDILLDDIWVYIVGNFTSVNQTAKNGIARINQTTGILDPLWGGVGISSPQVSINNIAIEKNPQTNDFVITVNQTANGTLFYDGTQVFGRVFSVDTLGVLNPLFGSTTDPNYGFNDYAQPTLNSETEIAFEPNTGDIVFVGDFDAFNGEFMPNIVLTDKYGTLKSTSDCSFPRITPTPTNTPTESPVPPSQTPTNTSTPTVTPTISLTPTITPSVTPTITPTSSLAESYYILDETGDTLSTEGDDLIEYEH